MLRKIMKRIPVVNALVLFILLLSMGCEEPASMIAADKVVVKTTPLQVPRILRQVNFCFGIKGRPREDLRVKLSDPSGLKVITVEEAFEDGFKPDSLVDGKHFFSVEDDPIHFVTRMTIINRNVFKRTHIEYNHLLPIANEPVLRTDCAMVAAGTIGEPKKGTCYLALLNLLSQQVKRVIPTGFPKEELETGRVVPIMWEDSKIHSVLILQAGRAVYFVSDDRGRIQGTSELAGAYVSQEASLKGWRITTPGGNPVLIDIGKGYFIVDEDSWKAAFFEWETPAKLLGVTSDRNELLVASFERDLESLAVFHRYPIGGTSGHMLPFGLRGARVALENVMFSEQENCIFYLDGKDIWRMDLHSGAQGKMFDTPDEEEVLLWVW
jgi:hypothetical protein